MRPYLILGDLHIGARGGMEVITSAQINYMAGEVLHYCKDNGITTIFQTGDMFDVRKGTDTRISRLWKNQFFLWAERWGIQIITLIGNHDMYLKHSTTFNSTRENLSEFDNVHIIDRPTEFVGDYDMLVVPWICKENEEMVLEAIRTTKCKNVMGHFEMKGARMESTVCRDGLDMSMFKKFDNVYSGHFHTKATYNGNIHYVGSPVAMTWGDYGSPKGFHVVSDAGIEFIENTHSLFHQLVYDDTLTLHGFEQDFRGKFVKVIVRERNNAKKFESLMLGIENTKPADLKIIEPFEGRSHEVTENTGEMRAIEMEDSIVEYVTENFPEKKSVAINMMLELLTLAEEEGK